MSDATPTIAQKAPYPIDVEAGKTYYWCTCGKSAKQPFCDGAHKGSEFAPKKFEVTKEDKYYLCGCKATANAPFCDGKHKSM